jgi:hypothetical protein
VAKNDQRTPRGPVIDIYKKYIYKVNIINLIFSVVALKNFQCTHSLFYNCQTSHKEVFLTYDKLVTCNMIYIFMYMYILSYFMLTISLLYVEFHPWFSDWDNHESHITMVLTVLCKVHPVLFWSSGYQNLKKC